MPKLTIDGIAVEVPQGATVLQACEAAGKEIPRLERRINGRNGTGEAPMPEAAE